MAKPTRRQHYIAKMVQRNFANADGRLYFWRRDFVPGDVRATIPGNLFVEGDIYTLSTEDGVGDRRVEQAFSRLESDAAVFLRHLLEIVRGGSTPQLNEEAWDFWLHYLFYSVKRVPAYAAAIGERSDHDAALAEIVDTVLSKSTASPEDVERERDPVSLANLSKDARILAQSKGPSILIAERFSKLGLRIIKAPRRTSFILGELASASYRSHKAATGKATFFPIAPDIAVGFSNKPRSVNIDMVDAPEVRRMNEAMAARSKVIAGSSIQLIASLSRAIPYRGVLDEI